MLLLGGSGVGSVCIEWGRGGRLWIYTVIFHSLLCRAVWSVVVFLCLRIAFWDFYWSTVLPANSSKYWSVSLSRTSNGAVFSMFISSYGCVLFRCVNRHYPLSFSNCKPKYRKSDDPAITVSTYYMLSIQIWVEQLYPQLWVSDVPQNFSGCIRF